MKKKRKRKVRKRVNPEKALDTDNNLQTESQPKKKNKKYLWIIGSIVMLLTILLVSALLIKSNYEKQYLKAKGEITEALKKAAYHPEDSSYLVENIEDTTIVSDFTEKLMYIEVSKNDFINDYLNRTYFPNNRDKTEKLEEILFDIMEKENIQYYINNVFDTDKKIILGSKILDYSQFKLKKDFDPKEFSSVKSGIKMMSNSEWKTTIEPIIAHIETLDN